MNRPLLILICYCLISSTAQATGFDYTTYKLQTLQQIKQTHAEAFAKQKKKSGYAITGDPFKYRMTVKFSREIRPITAANKQVLNAWAESLRVKQAFLDLYQREFKVLFGTETYWIPLQEPLIEAMGNELHPGDQFEVYVLLIGSISKRLVFLTTEFKSERIREY